MNPRDDWTAAEPAAIFIRLVTTLPTTFETFHMETSDNKANDIRIEPFKDADSVKSFLATHNSSKLSRQEALAFFHALPPVTRDFVLGLWRGGPLPVNSKLTYLLQESFGFFGTRFETTEDVHPFVFGSVGNPYSVDPWYIPLGMSDRHTASLITTLVINVSKYSVPLMITNKPRARLMMGCYGDSREPTCCMIYDNLPMIYYFKRVDERSLFVLMDVRGADEPFFFALSKVGVEGKAEEDDRTRGESPGVESAARTSLDSDDVVGSSSDEGVAKSSNKT